MELTRKTIPALVMTIFVATTAAFARADSGAAGASGATGSAGQRGSIGGIEAMYKWYPLCSLGSLIAAADDEVKLREYLAANCSVSEVAPHTQASMFVYSLTRQSPRLLALILADSRARNEVDVFATVPNVDVIKDLPLAFNPFELTVYNRLIDSNAPAHFPAEPFTRLFVDDDQLAMLRLLLSAANDGVKLKNSTSEICRRLRESHFIQHQNIPTAIQMIESRIAELSR